MANLKRKSFFDRLPDDVDIRNAEQLRKIVASQIKEGESMPLSLTFENGEVQDVTLTPALAASLLDVLRLVSSGRGFRMVPVEAELTTQQSADLLNVSRPYLIKLLEDGNIPYVKIGRHRRVRAEDIFAFKAERDANRSKALEHLVQADSKDQLL